MPLHGCGPCFHVAGKHHAAGTICDTIVWVGGNIIEELFDGGRGMLGGSSLLGADCSEGDDELVVHITCILIFVLLVGLEFAHDFGAGDLFATVNIDVFVLDDMEGVHAFDSL